MQQLQIFEAYIGAHNYRLKASIIFLPIFKPNLEKQNDVFTFLFSIIYNTEIYNYVMLSFYLTLESSDH